MQTNAILTIINRTVVNHKDLFLPTVLGPANWYAHQKQTVTDGGMRSANADGGMRSANAIRVRIPVSSPGRTYLPEVDWRALPADKRATFWTIQAGDLIVRGDVTDPVQSTAQIKDAYGPDAAVITGYADNRRGSAVMQHWRIDGE